MNLNQKYIADTLTSLGRKYGTRDVFEDFVLCCAYSLSNLTQFNKEREAEYLKISKKYEKEEFNSFSKMLAYLTIELSKDDCEDILGNLYEGMGLYDKGKSQFFTPLPVSDFMAKITFSKDNIQKEIETKGYISVADECCGSGRMLFAYLNLLKKNHIDISNVYFVGADISNLCCCMTYVNLSLMGANAIVNHQDTLLLKRYGYYITPELFFNKNLTDKLIRDGYLAIEKVNQESKISEEKLEEIEEELER